MASTDGISVAVEQAIHQGLREAIENIAIKHGIRVLDLRVTWRAIRSFPASEFYVYGLQVTTESGE